MRQMRDRPPFWERVWIGYRTLTPSGKITTWVILVGSPVVGYLIGRSL